VPPGSARVVLSLSACGGAQTGSVGPPSCEAAWNAPDNQAHRDLVVASGGPAWQVEVSRWTGIVEPAPGSSVTEDELRQDGCGYMFFTDERWLSFGGEWTDDGVLQWEPKTARGARTPEQRQFEATATIAPDGTIR
jgi:hypothetical protein